MALILFACAALLLVISIAGGAHRPTGRQAAAGSVTWHIDNLTKIGGQPVTIIGDPQIVGAAPRKAVSFDGAKDGLLIKSNPISGARAFTVEAVFRPERNGGSEQRWLHIQEETGDNRVLLETRLVGDQWFLDTYIKSGERNRTLYARDYKHPLDQWYHVALVYDGTEMRHYVNGVKELSGPLAISPLTGGQTSLGVRQNRVYWYKGAIRTARFTARALAPEEFMRVE